MSRDRLEHILQEAIRLGILPETARLTTQDQRPWPVVLLTALGAWLVVIPMLGVVGLLLGELMRHGIGPYFVGVLVMAGAVVILRARDIPLFVEQLALPAVLIGAGSLAFGLSRDMPPQAAAAVLAVIFLGVAWMINRTWLRVLMGAAAAGLMMIVFFPRDWDFADGNPFTRLWFTLHAVFALWVTAGWAQRKVLNDGAHTRCAAALESVSVGWLLVTLVGLAFWSGMTFMVGASFSGSVIGDVAGVLSPRGDSGWNLALKSTSTILAFGAAAWMAYRWPTLRQPWWAGVAAVLILLCWFMPTLGAVILALAFCISSGRNRLAAAAGLAAAWIIGAFYYQLSWPLADKAMLLVAAGSTLAAMAWLAARKGNASEIPIVATPAPTGITRKSQMGILLTTLLVLIVANVGIWQKEDLIAHGQPVFVELAPVDPRSLMQGDFMQLNFRLPDQMSASTEDSIDQGRPRVIGKRDARGVASLLRMDNGSPLATGEFLVELTPKNGGWVLVSDAWFFKEGEAARWAQARYGEFRVGASGRALLVELRGAKLERL